MRGPRSHHHHQAQCKKPQRHGHRRGRPPLHPRPPPALPGASPVHHLLTGRCRAFKQEVDGRDRDPSEPEHDARKRRKGLLYELKAAIQGLTGSRSAAAEVHGGEHQYQLAFEKAEEIFFSDQVQPLQGRDQLHEALKALGIRSV